MAEKRNDSIMIGCAILVVKVQIAKRGNAHQSNPMIHYNLLKLYVICLAQPLLNASAQHAVGRFRDAEWSAWGVLKAEAF